MDLKAQIAPLLARHCLECHDSASKQGGLDLSRRETALVGGKSGKAIIAGKAAQSLLWKHVASGRMPPSDRERLTAEEKQTVRLWIDAGAVWPAAVIDPDAHTGERSATDTRLRRLTVPEYIETVRVAVGVDVDEEARQLLPRDQRADGFSNTAYNLNTDLAHVEAYANLAEIITAKLDIPTFAGRYTNSRELTPANMRRLISGMGAWVLRGPLEEHEIQPFLRISSVVARDGADFPETARVILEAMLQSPRFIYHLEAAEGRKLPRRSDYEVASRLSYLLWGAPPDQELMRAAGAGELSNRAQVATQVRRMLQDPRAVAKSSLFVNDWLDLDRLANLRPNAKRFPAWNAALADDMRRETLAYFKELAWEQKRPLVELMNAQVTFATPRLAEHYGLAPNLTALSRDGLQALYKFDEKGGATVRDTSGIGEPLDLKIENPSAVQWRQGRLTVNAPTLIATDGPPKRLIDAVQKSKAITVEAWIAPADLKQEGPARVVTLSSGANQRNFTLGQEGNRYEVRYRARRSDANGLPGLTGGSGSAGSGLTHLVHTADAAGLSRLYVNGKQQAADNVGEPRWDATYRLALANETTKGRPWRGTFHLVAIYSRAFTPEEVRAKSESLTRYDLSSTPGRGGLLTHGSVLTMGGDDASMVERGLFVLHDLLYGKVGNPPPGVDTTPVPPKPGQSRRVVAEGRLTNPSCGGCHAKFEPLAFGLEKFDGVGAYHQVDEHGNKLREDGTILFPGQAKPAAFKTTAELMDLLARSERVQMNLTRKVTQFALGRPLRETDTPTLERIHASAKKSGGSYAALISAIAMSDLVLRSQSEIRR